MCGIAGIVGRDSAGSQPALERMQAALRHRGPDDEGLWRSQSNTATFAHTRLAVIDPGPGGHQPMSSPDGRFTITFSGEIYNFRDLRHELQGQHSSFNTQSDTEVILHGYQSRGAEFVSRLRGMFAFGIWDEQERTCFLARDPFGLKPLYFHHAPDGALMFASELRALVASRLIARELDPAGLGGYLRTGTVPEPHTIVKSVRALEAGHTLSWRDARITKRRYWSPRFADADPTTNHHSDTVRAALLDSVRHHFVSDVPVGIFLSGGIDSASLLALATECGHQNVHTVSLALPGSRDDEGALARRTAERFGAKHAECSVDARAARDLLPQYLPTIDQPSIDGFNTFVLSRFAREQGLKVVLSGVGADELFGGYRSFAQVPRMTAWNEHLAWAGPLRPLGGRMLEKFAAGPRWRRVGELLQQPPTIASTYSAFRAVFTRREAAQIAGSLGVKAPSDDSAPDEPRAAEDADEVSRLELTRYVRNQLVRDSDVASMACGLELRAPFLDRVLFDVTAAVPPAVRLHSAKQLLRDAVHELPPWVTGPKRCFQFPFADWLDGEWREVFAAADARSPVRTGTWYRQWCLLVLNDWMERMKVDAC